MAYLDILLCNSTELYQSSSESDQDNIQNSPKTLLLSESQEMIEFKDESIESTIIETQQIPLQNDPIDPDSKSPVEPKSSKIFKCLESTCDSKFFTKIERFHHMKLSGHYKEEFSANMKFYCYCGLIFSSRSEQNDHIRLSHNVRFKCNSCGKVVFNEKSCHSHIARSHKEGFFTVGLLTKIGNIFQCSICTLDFDSYESYKQHADGIDHYDNATYHYDGKKGNNGRMSEDGIEKNSLEKVRLKYKKSKKNGEASKSLKKSPKPALKSPQTDKSSQKIYSTHKSSTIDLNPPKRRKIDSIDIEEYSYAALKEEKSSTSCIKIHSVSDFESKFIPNTNNMMSSLKFYNNDMKLTKLIPIVRIEKLTNGIKVKFNQVDNKSSINETLTQFDDDFEDSNDSPEELDYIEVKDERVSSPVLIENQHEAKLDNSELTENSPTTYCQSCNRIVKTEYYAHHLQSAFHKFFIDFPQYRSEKTSRQQKLHEAELMKRLKFPCDICQVKVLANYFKSHVKSASHKFYLKNPNAERKFKRKPRIVDNNFSDDILIDHYDPKKVQPYICDYCRKKFFKKSTLEKHIRFHIPSLFIVKCTFCDEKFLTISAMNIHRKANHAMSDGSYFCNTCNKKYVRHREYLRHCTSQSHLKRADGNSNDKIRKNVKKKHTCFICNIDFKTGDSYKRHCGSYHVDENEFCTRVYKQTTPMVDTVCKICDFEFDAPNELQIHYVMDHDNEISFKVMTRTPIICHCGKIIPRKKYKGHVDNFHPPVTVCHICEKNFKDDIRGFRYHRLYGHLPYLYCDYCRYKVQSKTRLRKHVKYHIENRVNRFVCESCGKGFQSNYQLEKHVRFEHMGIQKERTHQCSMCVKKYTTRGKLKDHVKYAHDKVPRKLSIFCDICDGLGFLTQRNYNLHVLTKRHIERSKKIVIIDDDSS